MSAIQEVEGGALRRIRDFVTRHQLLVFFPLAYAITWAVWIPALTWENAGVISAWGAYGPALAGIVITRLVNPTKTNTGRKRPLAAFLLGLVIGTLVFLLLAWMRFGAGWPRRLVISVTVIGLISGLAPAFVISSVFSRNKALRDYLKSLRRPRGPAVYYILAVVVIPAVYWLGTLVSRALGQAALYSTPGINGWDGLVILTAAFITQFFYGNTLGEEVGWRGFALPRLQARNSPLVASLILSLLWFAWHLPLKILNPDPISYLFYGLSFVPQTILLTWLFNRSNGSILVVGIAHVMGNVVGKYLFAPSHAWLAQQFILAGILILADRMWEKRAPKHVAMIPGREFRAYDVTGRI